jgi:hypothetical protein
MNPDRLYERSRERQKSLEVGGALTEKQRQQRIDGERQLPISAVLQTTSRKSIDEEFIVD